jgi:hypothetical protein
MTRRTSRSGTVTRQGLDNIVSQGSSEQIATTYEADQPSECCKSPTYVQLLCVVCRVNDLKTEHQGITRGVTVSARSGQ